MAANTFDWLDLGDEVQGLDVDHQNPVDGKVVALFSSASWEFWAHFFTTECL